MPSGRGAVIAALVVTSRDEVRGVTAVGAATLRRYPLAAEPELSEDPGG